MPLPYVATLFFNLPSLHSPYLGRHQNGSQQRTVTRTRRLSLEPDDRYQNQTTVARARRPSLEPDDRYQNQTTITRARQPLPEPDDHRQSQTTITRTRRQQLASEHYKRFNRLIESK